MIPSRKFFVVTLVVAGAAGFVMAGVTLDFASLGRQDAQQAPAGDTATDGTGQATEETGAAAGARRAQEEGPPRRLLAVHDYESAGLTPQEAIEAHSSATEGPEQPIPFNHRFHVREIGMQCAYCHDGAQSSFMAPIPALDVCMGCHRIVGAQLEPIQELRAYWDRGEPVPWERVYKVPEFVQFPHEAHVRNDIECAECHGPVEDMDRVHAVTDLRMGWCLECHMGEGQESDYATDRLLARDFTPPQPPHDDQPVGLYPRTIDQRYGQTRAPIDCTACHY